MINDDEFNAYLALELIFIFLKLDRFFYYFQAGKLLFFKNKFNRYQKKHM